MRVIENFRVTMPVTVAENLKFFSPLKSLFSFVQFEILNSLILIEMEEAHGSKRPNSIQDNKAIKRQRTEFSNKRKLNSN